jgi:hypothetical protein
MTFLPVVAREMSVLARRKGTYWARTGTALAALVILGWLLAIASAHLSFIKLGRDIYVILSYIAFTYALVAGIHATADCISEEKREGTLGLLFLTDLKSYDLVLGKLSATSLGAAYALLALLPMISLGLLVGGVTLLEVAQVSSVLANTLFFSLGLGVFVSTLSTNERRAMFAAAVILFVLTAFPFVLVTSVPWPQRGARYESLLAISPLYPMLSLPLGAALPLGFTGANWVSSMLLHHGLAWFFLIASCSILPRFIIDLPSRRFVGLRKLFENYTYGNRRQRNAHRAKLLDRNAFLWLVSRERAKAAYAWGFVALFFGLYLWVYHRAPNLFFDLPVNAAIVLTVHLTLKLWLGSEVCHRLIQDRRGGALELLLSTPMTIRRIAHGQTLALRRIFLLPVAIIIMVEILFAIAAFRSGHVRPPPADRALTFLAAASILVLDLWALKWVGLWLSLWGKSVERVLAGTLVRVLAIPWILFATLYGLLMPFGSFAGIDFTYRQALLTWWVVSVLCALYFALPARSRFFKYFRACAANQFGTGAPVLEKMSVDPSEASGRRWFAIPPALRRYSAAGALSLLLIGLFTLTFGRKHYWQHRVASEMDRVRAAKLPGGQGDLAAFHPRSLPVADGANALLQAGLPSQVGQGFNVWNSIIASARGTFTGAAPEFEETLRHNRAQLHALWQLTNYTSLKVPPADQFLDFSLYPVLGGMDYLVASAQGDTQRVFKNVRGLLAYVRLMRQSPLPQSQHFAWAGIKVLSFVLERRHSLPSELLARISSELEAVDRDEVLGPSLTVIRGFFARTVATPHFPQNVPGENASAVREWMTSMWFQMGNHHKQLFLALRVLESGIESASLPYPQRLDRFQDWLENRPWIASRQPERLEIIAQRIVGDNYRRHAACTARLNVLRTAMAVQQYLVAEERFPADLGDLAPKYLKQVLLDPFAGQPLRAVRDKKGYIIYSIGPNRVDEQGAFHPDDSLGDIVFRFGPSAY